jgi:hypothetical protein
MATTQKIVEIRSGGQSLSARDVRARISAYRSQVHDYLENLDGNVDSYKFAVEKQGDGIVVDVAFRASIHPKNKAGITK